MKVNKIFPTIVYHLSLFTCFCIPCGFLSLLVGIDFGWKRSSQNNNLSPNWHPCQFSTISFLAISTCNLFSCLVFVWMHFYFSLQSSFSQTIFRHLLVGEKRGSSMGGSRHKFMNVRLSESSFTNGLSWLSKKYQHFCRKLFEFPEHLRIRWKSWMNEGRGKAEGTSPDSVMSRFLLSHCETLTRLLFFYFLTRLLHSNVSGYFLNGLLARGPVPKSFYLYPLIITLSPSRMLFLLSSKTWPVIAVRKAQRRRPTSLPTKELFLFWG